MVIKVYKLNQFPLVFHQQIWTFKYNTVKHALTKLHTNSLTHYLCHTLTRPTFFFFEIRLKMTSKDFLVKFLSNCYCQLLNRHTAIVQCSVTLTVSNNTLAQYVLHMDVMLLSSSTMAGCWLHSIYSCYQPT